ncbi:ABC transporter ATP-binding protein [Roseibium sp.]|uniref:ABC transporter ATP-binding protein n=1 Tax=Roseibium sp. TaxID=1936156 RepID=UPI0039EED351
MLNVKDLQLHLEGAVILDKLSFRLESGKTLCVIGESGSGKTSLLRSLQGLAPARFEELCFEPRSGSPVRYRAGWKGRPGLPGSRWVMQDPIAALSPKQKLGASIAESLHGRNIARQDMNKAVVDALQDVDLPAHFASRRPSEVSMGQAQRACLARALIARPDLIFFDEPLSALDAIVQKQVALTMSRIQRRYGISYVIVTHDLGFAAAYADWVLVLRRGRVEASQAASDFFNAPDSAYCKELIEAAEVLGELDTRTSADAGRAEVTA